jgi:hypothetical protein
MCGIVRYSRYDTAHELTDIILNILILNNTDDKIKKVILICKHYVKTKVLSVQWNTFKKGGREIRNGCSNLILNV